MKITETRLREDIDSGKSIRFYGKLFNEYYYDKILTALHFLFDYYGKPELTQTVGMVVQELAIHASLSNCRDIYYHELGYDLNNVEHISQNEASFIDSINETNLEYYKSKAKSNGLYLNVEIQHNYSAITVLVTNNSTPSTPFEGKLREYLKKAMHYNSIMEYFENNVEDPDGRGIGLALAIILLKESMLRPELMRLGYKNKIMTSRVEIPLDQNYVSIRDRILRDEKIVPFEHSTPLDTKYKASEVITVKCPLCQNDVDERIFFDELPPEFSIDTAKKEHELWRESMGACANCITIYSN
jgi:hypothetical protein